MAAAAVVLVVVVVVSVLVFVLLLLLLLLLHRDSGEDCKLRVASDLSRYIYRRRPQPGCTPAFSAGLLTYM